MKGEYIRCIHLDVTNNAKDHLINLNQQLTDIVNKTTIIENDLSGIHLKKASDEEYELKLKEMLGKQLTYRISQFADEHMAKETVAAADTIIKIIGKLEQNKLQRHALIRNTEIDYDNNGVILQSSNSRIIGHDILHYAATTVHQDVAVIVKKENQLIYSFDCSMYEKTPKDPKTGNNSYLGRDLLEFHGKAKTFGNILPSIMEKLSSSFEENLLDMLTIDLNGANTFTNGKVNIRRFERDYITPVRVNNRYHGILAYASVCFQDISETKTPYDRGAIIDISSPLEIHSNYELVNNDKIR